MAGAAGALLIGSIAATPAWADLRLCNKSPSRVGVAIGYRGPKGWTTEGWWTISAKKCETLLKGKLPTKVYYVHAIDYDRGGGWRGPFQMCTGVKAFVARGTENCKQRGLEANGFFEVNIGAARSWTIQLADPAESAQNSGQ